MFEQSRHSAEITARNSSTHAKLYFFDIVEDYPEIGGVASVSRRLRSALQSRLGTRFVAVREIAEGLGCGDAGEDYLARERRAILRLARVDPAATFLVPNFQNPLGRVANLHRPKIVNIVHDVQFAHLPELFSSEQLRWLDAAFAETRVNADAIAFVSRTTRDHFVARYGAPARCRVIAAPIGATTPGRAAASRPPFLLAVQHSQCHPHKNVAGLVRLFARLAERTPALTLLVTGRGSASLETECESLPRHVRDRIHHLGHVSRAELTGLYGAAEALVSLSRFEGFNMSAAEAASCGTPLILSDLPVHRELHSGTACFLDPTMPDVDLAAAFLADAGPRLRGYVWGHAKLCSAASVAQAHIGLIADLETRAAEVAWPLAGAHRISATTRVFRVGTGRCRAVPARRPIAAAVSRQKLARALLAGTILGGSTALMLGGSVVLAKAESAAPTTCSPDGTNAAGGGGGNGPGNIPAVTTGAGGLGGCETGNLAVTGLPGTLSNGYYGGGGGGAGGSPTTAAGAGGSGQGTSSNGGTAGSYGTPAGNGASGSTATDGGGGGGGGYYGGTLTSSGTGYFGGNGGNGGTAVTGGGGGGGGGVGTGILTNGLTLSGTSHGGNGGNGGSTTNGGVGRGGQGGIGTFVSGAVSTFTLAPAAQSIGGYGGNTGSRLSGTGAGGAGGDVNAGGAGLFVSSSLGLTLQSNGSIIGGTGGGGGSGTGADQYGFGLQGRIGGSGGDGLLVGTTIAGSHAAVYTVAGGNGGLGGSGGTGAGGNSSNGFAGGKAGNGGAAGVGVNAGGLAITVISGGSVTGGSGGLGGIGGTGGAAGGSTYYGGVGGNGGNGGTGAAGVQASGTTITVQNGASITGGAGGTGGVGGSGGSGGVQAGSQGTAGTAGLGGAGISGANLSIIDAGTISGGFSGDGLSQADALHLTGGLNTLTMLQPSTTAGTLSGNIYVGVDNTNTGSLNVVVSTTVPNAYSPLTVANTINGSGSIEKSGDGVLILTGSNTYTGGTQLNAGTLAVGSSNALGSGALTFNGGSLQAAADGLTLGNAAVLASAGTIDTQNFGLTYAGAINGAGSLTKAGTGTLTLIDANAYTGGTTVAAGTLQVGNGGTTGGITGNILDNGALVFNRSDVVTLAGMVSGTGSLTKAGTGTLVLTGTDTYTGGTTIATGTLQIGNGGTTGAIPGNVVDNGTLAFNRSDAIIFAGAISGSGSLTQAGSGTLNLTGTSSYTGPTDVQSGRLAVNGALGNTSVTVRSGATLGGSGAIAGPVTIADGGILAPGNSPGTLTVGSLTLTSGSNGSPGSILNYELGTIAAPGGQASDLTKVIGNLTLAGTLNVSDPSGSFTSGSYRLIDYGGTLTNNGLSIGTLPGTFTGVIQTAVANQVNLIVAAAGVSVQFWDGPSTSANGTINGGTGTWNNSLTNWTDPNGATNAPWGRGLAVFAGAAGTVTVADAIAFQSLQFSTGEYIVDANGTGTLNPTGQATILVDSGLTATIAASITGQGGITKDHPGTLVLAGTDTYTGGTTIAAGTLQIGNGGTGGSITGNVLDNGSLTFNRSDTMTFAGAISGSGSLTQAGPGTLTLTGQNTYSGTTTIAAGTLTLSGQGSIAGSSQLVDNGVFDVSASSNGVSLASLGGTGGVVLGSNALTLTNASGTFGGMIGGAGQLILQAGTEVLSGPNTYAGGTTIAGGTLQIGDSAALGSGTVVFTGGTLQAGANGLTVANAVQLSTTGIIDTQTYSLGYTGTISGPGQLSKTGTGKLTLSQANSYSGGTFLQQGTLALGNAGALGTGPLAMDQNTTLLFSKSLTLGNDISFTGLTDPTINTAGHDSTISGTLSGPGALTKQGAGTLTLTADNTYTGPTTVAAGTLAVDGGIASSAATVDNGATLSGSGTVGSLAARNGATVSPGTAANPYGTLHVSGAASFASGATFAVSINPVGQSSKLAVGGTATLGGAGVTVASASGTYNAATQYTVLTASGGVKGLFGSVSTATALAFLNPYLSYGSNDVTLAFRSNGASFATVAITPNQQSVTAAIQGLDPNSPVVRSLQGLSPDQARRALDALAGATHASAVTATTQDAGRVRTLLFDRLWNIGGGELDARTLLQQMNASNTSPTFVNCFAPLPARPATPPTVYTAWGEGFGDFGHDSGDRNGAGLDHSLGGFVLGIDAPIHGLGAPYRVGIAGGYAQDSFTATGSGAGGSAGTSETIFGAIYGGTRYGAVDVRLGVSAAHDSTNVNRNISYPGFNEAERSNYGGNTEQAFGELGYRVAGPRYVFEPTFGAAYIHVHQDSFREQGGAAALLGFAQDTDLGTTTLGARGEIAPITGMPLVARAFLGWRHTFGDINPISRLAFVAAPIPFTSQGAPIDTDVLAAEAGLDYRYSAAVSVGVSYVGQVGPRDYDHGVKGRIEYKF